MGRSRRPRPKRLAFKLYTIRRHLGLTLDEMIKRLRYDESPLHPSRISEYERGTREPPLLDLFYK